MIRTHGFDQIERIKDTAQDAWVNVLRAAASLDPTASRGEAVNYVKAAMFSKLTNLATHASRMHGLKIEPLGPNNRELKFVGSEEEAFYVAAPPPSRKSIIDILLEAGDAEVVAFIQRYLAGGITAQALRAEYRKRGIDVMARIRRILDAQPDYMPLPAMPVPVK